MRIAIVGGGASGLITAYLLRRVHEVHLYEREPILGGNVRTLNGNVQGAPLDRHAVVENGVVLFNQARQPLFLKLLEQLRVEAYVNTIGSGVFLADGRCWQIPCGDALRPRRLQALWGIRRALSHIGLPMLVFLARTGSLRKAPLAGKPFSHFLTSRPTLFNVWMKALGMGVFSTPYPRMADFPAEIAIPWMRTCMLHPRWHVIKDGTYAYMAKILSLLEGKVSVDAEVVRVAREQAGAQIGLVTGETRAYDKVVFATTPEQVLRLLADPTDSEKRRFGAWQEHRAKTVAHTDTTFYQSWRAKQYVESDFFQKRPGDDYGYNCCMNRCRRIPPPVYYSYAYNMEEFIRPDRIIDAREHRTPGYTLEAVSRRREVIDTNGENHTYHAGAYLGDGTHEGAAQSAGRVSRLLGGATIG